MRRGIPLAVVAFVVFMANGRVYDGETDSVASRSLPFSILGSVTSNPTDRARVLDFVLRYFPRQFEFVTTQQASMQEARVRLGVAGSLLMIWASMGVFGAITTAVNHAWGAEKQPSYLKHKLISFIMLAVKDPAIQVQLLVWIFMMRVMMVLASAGS